MVSLTNRQKNTKEQPAYTLKAIRFSSMALVYLVEEAACEVYGDRRGSWNTFIAQAAKKMADLTLAKKLSPTKHFLPKHHIPRAVKTESTFCTNVSLPAKHLPLIQSAACRLNHHISPFLAWAALIEARRVLDYYPTISRRQLAKASMKKEGALYTISTMRFPVEVIERIDEWCEKEGASRSDFLVAALTYLKDRLEVHNVVETLPESHSLRSDKKMVSFTLPTKLRNQADAAGAVINHNSTGLSVYASLVFLNSQK